MEVGTVEVVVAAMVGVTAAKQEQHRQQQRDGCNYKPEKEEAESELESVVVVRKQK